MSGWFNTVDSSVLSDKQRLKRTEVLLSQLYREDVNPQFQLPEMRGVKTMAIISVLGLVLFTGTLFFKFNSFILLREDVYSTRGNLDSYMQRRTNLFANMMNLTLNHAALEHAIFSYAAKMRTQSTSGGSQAKPGGKELAAKVKEGSKALGLSQDMTATIQGLLGGGAGGKSSASSLMAVVEKYPDIKSAMTYKETMVFLVNSEDLIATKRMQHTEALRMYNTMISKFPWSVLASWTDFKRIEYFEVSDSISEAPAVSSKTYEPLIPFMEHGYKEPEK